MAHQKPPEWFTDPRISLPIRLYSIGEELTLEAQTIERKLAAICRARPQALGPEGEDPGAHR